MSEPAQMTPSPPAGDARPGSKLARLAACPLFLALLLAAVTLAVYLPATRNDFVSYDDPQYVTDNAQVQGGLTREGVVWAFRTGHADNWHPLTWLSHMLDCQLYGLKPAGHHLTNLLLHVVNTVLLFILLRRLTGAVGRSAFVAALFALHPLHVESVAWVSERKDVLSALFFMLTLWAYARYAECKAEMQNAESEVSVRIRWSHSVHASRPHVLYLLPFPPLLRPGPPEQADARHAALCPAAARLLAAPAAPTIDGQQSARLVPLPGS